MTSRLTCPSHPQSSGCEGDKADWPPEESSAVKRLDERSVEGVEHKRVHFYSTGSLSLLNHTARHFTATHISLTVENKSTTERRMYWIIPGAWGERIVAGLWCFTVVVACAVKMNHIKVLRSLRAWGGSDSSPRCLTVASCRWGCYGGCRYRDHNHTAAN